MFRSLVFLMLSCLALQAAVWDEAICSWNISSSRLTPGQSFSVNVSASAQRNQTSTFPVRIYHTLGQSLSGARFLGSVNVTVQQPGSFCSSIARGTFTLPAVNLGDCFSHGRQYIAFQAGSDVKYSPFTTSGDLPVFSGMTPAAGEPGTVVTITGANFEDGKTFVQFGGVDAQLWRVDDAGTLRGMVPTGAQSGKVSLQYRDGNLRYCVAPLSQSPNYFMVPDGRYCASAAFFDLYGRIEAVSSDEFSYDVAADSSCSGYTDNRNYALQVTQGQSGKQIGIRFGACDQPDYSKMFKAYADFNGDGDFNDPGEYLVAAPSVSSGVDYTLSLSIPANAVVGDTRLRFVLALYDNGFGLDTADKLGPCTLMRFGETHDYTLQISPAATKTATSFGSVQNTHSFAVDSEFEEEVQQLFADPDFQVQQQ